MIFLQNGKRNKWIRRLNTLLTVLKKVKWGRQILTYSN
jgi:hypothetical protein